MAEPIALTDEFIYSIAPDGKSVLAAEKLLKANAYRKPKCSDDGTRVEAICQGTFPYAVRIDLTDPKRPQTGCNCGSFKRPCKHAIGLLMLLRRSPEAFGEAAAAPPAREKVEVQRATVHKQAAVKQKAPKDTGEALVQAIFADPKDDAPRLIYADWLDERGGADEQARAEFIRTQVALAGMEKGDPQAKALRAREAELWDAHRDAWLKDVPEELRKRKKLVFHRGFLEELQLASSTWITHGARLFSKFPIYRVRLSGRVDRHQTGNLVVNPYLARIRELSLEGATLHEPMKTLKILFDTPFLSGLSWLNLRDTGLDSRQLGLLVDSPLLARLQYLDLSANPLGRTGIEQLAAAPASASLRELRLESCPIGDEAAKALAASPHLDELKRLDLRSIDLGQRALAAVEEHFGERVLLD